MFSLFVRRDGLIDPPEMGRTDAHCHILPGIDDGPTDIRGSLAIARLLLEMGVTRVVATPHVIADIYPNTTESITRAVEELNRTFRDSGLNLTVVPGAEYYAEPQLIDRIKSGDLLAFDEQKYVLFESPVETRPHLLDEIVFNLASAGYTPLLAHAERYRYLQGKADEIDHLRRLGAKFQVNHPSFLLPKTSRRGEMARWLYIKGLVELLGTDMHRATGSAQASLEAYRKRRAKARP